MVRVKSWVHRHRKHHKLRLLAKWFRLGRSKVHKQIKAALVKQGQHAYKGRKEKKRDFRKLWIERLSAVVRAKWSKYSSFVDAMNKKDILIDRKVLSNIAVAFPEVFEKIYEEVMK